MNQQDLERLRGLSKQFEELEKKARMGGNEGSKEIAKLQQSIIRVMNSITGDNHFIGKEKDIFASEPFNQVIHRNLDFLIQINYLSQKEESFLFRIQPYLEFKSNVIIKREDKFKKKPKKKKVLEDEEYPQYELAEAANVSDIADMLNMSRKNVSLIMNSLKKKELLLNPEGAGMITENGRTVTPRTWIVNPYILCCAPRKNGVKIDVLTMRLFQHSLKNIKDENGKTLKLPVRFF